MSFDKTKEDVIPEDIRMDVSRPMWLHEQLDNRLSHIAIAILGLLVIGCIAENVTTSLLPKCIADIKEYNNSLTVKKQLESNKTQIKSLQDELTETKKKINPPVPPVDKNWQHAWQLREAEAQYAYCKILQDFVVETNGKYEVQNAALYREVHSIFENQDIPIQREASAAIDKLMQDR